MSDTKQTTPLPWLKLWHNFLDSMKIQSVTEALRARYVNLLCLACKYAQNGKLPELNQVAFMIRLSSDEAQETLDKLIEAGLIEKRGKSYWIHDWDQWQHHKSRAAEKQKRYRDKTNALRTANGNALPTRDVTESNVLPRVREEKEGDKEKEKNTLLKPPRGGKLSIAFVLDSRIPQDLWDDFEEMRKKIRKPMTDRARWLIAQELTKLAAAGHQIEAVLEQSIRKCWQDVFPIAVPYSNGKAPEAAAKPKRTPEEQERLDAAAARNANR